MYGKKDLAKSVTS